MIFKPVFFGAGIWIVALGMAYIRDAFKDGGPHPRAFFLACAHCVAGGALAYWVVWGA